jgi:hypothetical protein
MKGLLMDKKRKIFFVMVITWLFFLSIIEIQAQEVGWWRGIIEQPMADKSTVRYIIEMTLYGNKGKINYPMDGCDGELILEKKDGNNYIYREHIIHGRDKCIDQGLITVSSVDIGKLKFIWQGSGITATGYLFGPLELDDILQELMSNNTIGDEFLSKIPSADVYDLLYYELQIGDGNTSLFVAFTYIRSLLEWNGKKLLCMIEGPDDKNKNIYLTITNYALTESIVFQGDVDRLHSIFIRVNMSSEAIADVKKQHSDWEMIRSYAKLALLMMVPSSYDEGIQWVNTNLGKKKAHTTFNGCKATLETRDPEPAVTKVYPSVKAVIEFTVGN